MITALMLKRYLSLQQRLLLLTAVSLPTLLGQAPTGIIQGRVTDATGAAIVGANVTIEAQQTGFKQTQTTNADGRFVQPALPPAAYRVTVEKTGFSKYITNDLNLNAAQTLAMEIPLKIGDITTSIEVSSQATLLKTETSSASTTITQRQIIDLPTGRNPFGLANLTVGVIPGGGSTPWISGGRNSTSEILIDGNTGVVPENNVSINDGGYTPVQDSIGEVSVIKNSLAAEYGRSGGGVITATTRSGTNEYHFQAYEYFRNPKLNANSWANTRNGLAKPNCCSFNQFGFTAGGPLSIPGLYKAKNKTFLFWSQQWTKNISSQTPTASVPLQSWREGNFADLRNGAGQPIVIYDPLTVRDSGTTLGERSPFAGNVIPVNRMDPVGRKLVSFFPAANNVPTNQFTNAANFLAVGKQRVPEIKFDSRLDHYFSEKLRMFARGSYSNAINSSFNGFGNAGTSIGSGLNTSTFPNVTSNFVYTVNPTMIVNISLGFGQKDVTTTPFSRGTKPSDLGFPGSVDSAVGVGGLFEFPRIDGINVSSLGQATFTSLDIKSYAYTGRGDVTKVLSNHTIKAGFEYRKLMLNFTQHGQPGGQYNFGNSPTVRFVNQTNPTTEGYGFAGLLLGLPTGGSMSHTFSAATASPYVGFFFQDDWKVSRKLTLNIGLRWDADIPRTERFNRMNTFKLSEASPIAGKVPAFPAFPAGTLPAMNTGNQNLMGAFVQQTANSRRQVPTDRNNYGPRFGFAYQITPKTVFRGAYGVMYSGSSFTASGTSGTSGTQGYQSGTNYVATNDNYRTYLTTLSNPFPNGFNFPAAGPGNNLGLGISDGLVLTNQSPMIQQWNTNLQRELPGGVVIEVGYLGSKGHQLVDGESNLPLNQLTSDFFAMGDRLNAQVTNPFFQLAGINTTSGLYTQRTTQLRNLLVRYPQYQGVSYFRVPNGNSNYHSLTIEVNKRFSKGLQFLASFTGGKLLDDVSQPVTFQGAAGTKQDAYNRKGDKSVSAQDVSRRLVVSGNYELPFGRGRTVLNSISKPLDFIVGGWQVNGIFTGQTGTPVAITGGGNNGINAPGNRPNNNGTSSKLTNVPETVNAVGQLEIKYFDPAVFSAAPNFSFGSVGRFLPDVRNPSTMGLDFSAFKNFVLREKFTTQFRMESFNFTNHPNWSAPGNNVTAPGTFGIITGKGGNRTIQLALRLNF